MPHWPDWPNLTMFVPDRIVIYPRDVQNITGCSERSARRILQRIRIANKKTDEQFVSVTEFCAYTGLKEEDVRRFLV